MITPDKYCIGYEDGRREFAESILAVLDLQRTEAETGMWLSMVRSMCLRVRDDG